tara:strand:- start:9045 stop:9359 length:315 start_codon:yes stop_codon:yes gene_type:complete
MGYVKITKPGISSGVPQFDILSAEGVADIKLQTGGALGKIIVTHLGNITNVTTIIPYGWDVGDTDTHFTQVDAQLLENAIGTMGGGSGMIASGMSKNASEVTYA